MLTYKQQITADCGDIILPKKTMFFDIETTGFSPDTTHLYMIGCCLYEDDGWQLIQWFDDTQTFEGEAALLSAFSSAAKKAEHCISFNGQTFDFPYIKKKAAVHNMSDPLSHLGHTDLYRSLKPYRDLFKTPDFKQKSVEAFLGLHRKDTYSGKELIHVYHNYIRCRDDAMLSCLMLHNFEDVRGMFDLLPMMAYLNFFNGEFTVTDKNCAGDDYFITLKLQHFIQIPVTAHTALCSFSLSAYTAQLIIHGFEGQLKYFYKNYKDYEYLTLEDEAIHKSVAAFVDKKFRQKATRQNCYTKKTDYFLPEADTLFTPVFKYSCEDKQLWFPASVLDNEENLITYAHHLIASYGK